MARSVLAQVGVGEHLQLVPQEGRLVPQHLQVQVQEQEQEQVQVQVQVGTSAGHSCLPGQRKRR